MSTNKTLLPDPVTQGWIKRYQILSSLHAQEFCGPPLGMEVAEDGKHLHRSWQHSRSCLVGRKFLPSDFFQMNEYMNISYLFALAAFSQIQQFNIPLNHQNRFLSSFYEFSRGLCMSGHRTFFKVQQNGRIESLLACLSEYLHCNLCQLLTLWHWQAT